MSSWEHIWSSKNYCKWTPYNENWFRKRLSDIKNGEGCLPVHIWHSHLRGENDHRKLKTSNLLFAEEFIQEHVSLYQEGTSCCLSLSIVWAIKCLYDLLYHCSIIIRWPYTQWELNAYLLSPWVKSSPSVSDSNTFMFLTQTWCTCTLLGLAITIFDQCNGPTTSLVSSLHMWMHILGTTSIYSPQPQLPKNQEAAFVCSGKGQRGLGG